MKLTDKKSFAAQKDAVDFPGEKIPAPVSPSLSHSYAPAHFQLRSFEPCPLRTATGFFYRQSFSLYALISFTACALLFIFGAASSSAVGAAGLNVYERVFPNEIVTDMVFSGKVYLRGDCVIREGARVTILPGTRIIPGGENFSLSYDQRIGKRNIDTAIKGKAVIIVEGSLEAVFGKDLQSVMGAMDEQGGAGGIRWGGIVVAGKGQLTLKGVQIKDAVYGILAAGSADVFLDMAEIKNCGIGIISANESYVQLKNSRISANATSGIELYDSGRVRAEKSMILSNRQSGVMARHRSNISLTACEITHNSKGLHIRDAANADLNKNLFHANGTDIDSIKKHEAKPLPAVKEDVLWRGMVEITEDFIVPFGASLRIEEGTKIFVSSYSANDLDFEAVFADGKRKITSAGLCDVIIEGNIVIEGSDDKPVIFIAPSGFGSIIMSGEGASSSISNLVFSGRGSGFFILDENAAKFKSSVFEDFFSAFIFSDGAKASFTDCLFSNCRWAVLIYDSARPFFTGCSFRSNTAAVGMSDSASPFFRDCAFEKNETAISAAGASHPDCAGSSLKENTNAFVFFENSSGRIAENTFVLNKSAVRLKGNSSAEINKNAFIKNTAAILMDASSSSESSGNSYVKNGADREYAPTESPTLKGIMAENEVWSGTIELKGDLLVKEGALLRIKSGTKILVEPSEKDFVLFRDIAAGGSEMTRTGLVDIIVEGVIHAEEMTISGSSLAAEPSWGGFVFVKNAEGFFKNTSPENAETAFALFDKSTVFIEEGILKNCRNGVLLYGESVMTVKKCRITGSEKGLGIFMNSVCNISLSVITGNNRGITLMGGALSAENNLISKNTTGADIIAGAAVFKENSFLANSRALETRVAFQDQDNKFFENKTDIFENLAKK